MRSSLIVAAVIGSGAFALTGTLPATAMTVAQLKQVAPAQVETVGWCHRRWHRGWYSGYVYSGTPLYFGPYYVYGNKKAGW